MRREVPDGCTLAPGALPRLKVSPNHRFVVTAAGRSFFWLGDTAWELFHRLNREEAGHYLQRRAAQGFTIIQAVALAGLDGLKTPNAYPAQRKENAVRASAECNERGLGARVGRRGAALSRAG